MDLKLLDIKQNSQIDEFITQTDKKLNDLDFPDHGRRHANIVCGRAIKIAKTIELTENDIEYCAVAGYCHDIGNFIDRKLHHYWGSILFHQIFSNKTNDIEGLSNIVQAIANHDKEEARITNNISAVLIIADKSDVHRDRVKEKDKSKIMSDIHNRVNYSVIRNDLDINKDTKVITLLLKLDTKITPIIDYFEIFLKRMKYCRSSAT
jgi:metal-dependent HD superfamily phosphatase/phosphodiesterase